MAKTRMLKHDLRTSEKVASWPREIRYFWALLWGYVDDHGKGKDNPLLVKADCLPMDEDLSAVDIDGWLWHLASEGVLARFTFDGADYLQVVNWTEHQKPPHPTKDVLPSFDDSLSTRRELHAPCMKDAGSTHAPLTSGLGLVKSGFGSGSVIVSSPPVMEFDTAWAHWPKKVERKKAFERFKIAAPKHPELVGDIIRFGDAYTATTEKQFVPALGVWLSGERWTDELPQSRQTKPTKDERALSLIEQGRAMDEAQSRKELSA